jgi:uracil-DNA glycosylase family 4
MSRNSELAQIVADLKEQILYMNELGVDSLSVDLSRLDGLKVDVPAVPASAAAEKPVFVSPVVTPRPVEPAKPFVSRLGSLPTLSDRTALRSVSSAKPVSERGSKEASGAGESIEQIRAEIGHACTRCKLHMLGRRQVVNSTGHFSADLMFVGEAPGADEDEQGAPFVGRAGQLLTKIIESIGLQREDVFIGNINRCRPPGNRAPEPDESVICKPFLLREIAVVKPRVIVVLGATAAQNLLETKVPIGKLRGQFHEYLGVKVMPTFHPAYLLRDPNKKREVWEDMKMVRDYLVSGA